MNAFRSVLDNLLQQKLQERSCNFNDEIETFLQSTKHRLTQTEYYQLNNASANIMALVKMSNKKFGECVRHILVHSNFGLKNSPNTDWDMNYQSKKIELKSSRFWGAKYAFRWQHIMIGHSYDYVLLVGIEFNRLQLWIISKSQVIKLYNQNIIKQQGNAEGQGLWFSYAQVKDYITPLYCPDDLKYFAQ